MSKKLTLAKKIGMTRVYESLSSIPVTVLSLAETEVQSVAAGAEVVLSVRGSRTRRVVVPVVLDGENCQGKHVPDFLVPGAKVDVIGVSKGHGFTGVMQRYGFSGLGAAHGVKKVHRSGGSVGQNTEPGRVHPGTKMAGRHGGRQVTVRNLRVVSYDRDRGVLSLEGAVPGHRNAILAIRAAGS